MIPVFNSDIYKNKQLFIDYCHLSPEGSKLAAEALFSKVEESVIKNKFILRD
jgi:lysophospholipase L1-like esterase